MTAVASADGRRGTNDTAGARRIAAAFARARTEGRAALIPYVVAGYPDAETSFAAALAAADAGADLLEVGLPYSDPLADGATLQRASGVALAAGATFERSLRLIERIGARPAGPAARADGLRQPGHRRRRRRGRREAARRRRRGRAHRRRPDARRGRAVRGRRPRRRPRRRLPRRADDAAGPARRGRGAQRRLPVLRLARRRDRRSDGAAVDGRRLVRDVKAASPVPVAVGFGVSQPAHVRAIAKAGADGVIVASALVDALGPDGRDVAALARLVAGLRFARRPAGVLRPLARYWDDHEDGHERRSPSSSKRGCQEDVRAAIDWPGWSRSGKTEELALEALVDVDAPATRPWRRARVEPFAGGVDVRRRRARRGRRRHRLRRPVVITDADATSA